jgi:hypothetical protein
MSNPWPTVVAGFPEMWSAVYQRFKSFFTAAKNLESLHNGVFKVPVSGEMPQVIGRIVKLMANDYGAVLTLVLNGYGVQAMKIARSMFEAECNVHYLKSNQQAVKDYIDFNIIDQKSLYDLMDPAQKSTVDPARLERMNADYAGIAQRFVRNKKGELRDSWCEVSIYKRAQSAGLGGLYETFYNWASSMHHADIASIVSSYDADADDLHMAPSLEWLDQALVAAHGSLVRSLSYYLEVANIGFENEIQQLMDECVAVFKSLG